MHLNLLVTISKNKLILIFAGEMYFLKEFIIYFKYLNDLRASILIYFCFTSKSFFYKHVFIYFAEYGIYISFINNIPLNRNHLYTYM